MKLLITILGCLYVSQLMAVDAVKVLEIDRYMGKWNQIGAIPQRFAKDCVRDTTAEYKVLEDGLIEVKNTCIEENGEPSVALGRARVNEDFNMNSKLEVTFVKFFGSWIFSFGGDYWVIDLDKNYEWSLVGHPELSGLYILSRETKLPNSTLKNMRSKIESLGYDSCDVIMSPTPGGKFKGDERFCDLNL